MPQQVSGSPPGQRKDIHGGMDALCRNDLVIIRVCNGHPNHAYMSRRRSKLQSLQGDRAWQHVSEVGEAC